MSTEAPPSPRGPADTQSLGCFRPPRSGVSVPPLRPRSAVSGRPPSRAHVGRALRRLPLRAPGRRRRAPGPRRYGLGRAGAARRRAFSVGLTGRFPFTWWVGSFLAGKPCFRVAAPCGGGAEPAADSAVPAVLGPNGERRAVVSPRLTRRSGAGNCSKSSCRCSGKSED